MADRRHTVTQLDFFIRQVTLFADEIRNAVGQKLDVLGFKTTGRDLGEQMAFGFLLEFLQKVVVILCDRFACHRIQCLGKILLGETVCIRQALGQGLFHFIGKLPVRRMNLFANSLAYIKEIVKSEFGIPVDANGNALCTGNQNFCLWWPIAFVLPESKHPRPVRTQEVCCQNCAYGTAMQMPDNPASCVHFGRYREP